LPPGRALTATRRGAAGASAAAVYAVPQSASRQLLRDRVEPLQHEVVVQLERNREARRGGAGGAAGQQAHEPRRVGPLDRVEPLDRAGLRVLAAARDRVDRLRRELAVLAGLVG